MNTYEYSESEAPNLSFRYSSDPNQLRIQPQPQPTPIPPFNCGINASPDIPPPTPFGNDMNHISDNACVINDKSINNNEQHVNNSNYNNNVHHLDNHINIFAASHLNHSSLPLIPPIPLINASPPDDQYTGVMYKYKYNNNNIISHSNTSQMGTHINTNINNISLNLPLLGTNAADGNSQIDILSNKNHNCISNNNNSAHSQLPSPPVLPQPPINCPVTRVRMSKQEIDSYLSQMNTPLHTPLHTQSPTTKSRVHPLQKSNFFVDDVDSDLTDSNGYESNINDCNSPIYLYDCNSPTNYYQNYNSYNNNFNNNVNNNFNNNFSPLWVDFNHTHHTPTPTPMPPLTPPHTNTNTNSIKSEIKTEIKTEIEMDNNNSNSNNIIAPPRPPLPTPPPIPTPCDNDSDYEPLADEANVKTSKSKPKPKPSKRKRGRPRKLPSDKKPKKQTKKIKSKKSKKKRSRSPCDALPPRKRRRTCPTPKYTPTCEVEEYIIETMNKREANAIFKQYIRDGKCTISPNEYWCKFETCNKKFGSKCHLKRHCDEQHIGRGYKCIYKGCNSKFKQRMQGKEHVKNIHFGDNSNWFCYLCQKEFTRWWGVRRHLELKRCDLINSKKSTCIYNETEVAVIIEDAKEGKIRELCKVNKF